VPHVLTRHNSKRVACHWGNRYLYGTAIDLLVVVSRGVLERFEEFFRRGVLDPARIPVIPSSIDFERYNRPIDADKLRRELGLAPGSPIVGSVGRLVRDKGQHVLLRAFESVLRRRPQARLVLAGTGTEAEALKALASELGIAGSVHFLGFRNDVPEVTAALDVAVLASIDCDASPAVVKEAMYLRKPVVVTDIGGLREMVEDGVTGRVVPPGEPAPLADAIDAMLAGGDAVRAMGERAREVVATRYSLAALAGAYEAAYAELLARMRRRRS
jgi:glycosyltransferase involved in cell wall biosynthesis